jgi:hypothetical protein
MSLQEVLGKMTFKFTSPYAIALSVHQSLITNH